MSDPLRPHRLYSPGNSLGQNTGVGSLSFLQGTLPNPGIKSKVSRIAGGFFPAEPPGKSKNTRVGSLSLLQQIFRTQESNWGLLQGRRMILSRDCRKICLDDELGLFEEVWVTPENREVARNIPRKILCVQPG